MGTDSTITDQFADAGKNDQYGDGRGKDKPHTRPPIDLGPGPETTVGQDIGNFFRVLFAFIAGLWNRDFAEFDLLSGAYFPPTPEKPESEKSVEERSVERMRRARENPEDPLRSMSTRDVVRNLTQGMPPNAGFDQIVEVFLPFEGGYNPNEPRGAVANYGINSEAHPGLDVKHLTKAQAIQIYRSDYWNAVDWTAGGKTSENQLSANVKLLIFDSAAQYGTGFANKLLRDSYQRTGGNVENMPAEIFKMRRQKYAQLIHDDPATYAQYKNNWEARLRKLEGITSASGRWDMAVSTHTLIVTPPVDIAKYAISSDYGMRNLNGTHLHSGTDYATPRGTALPSQYNGIIASMKTFSGYGTSIVIDHGDGVFEMSTHLSRYTAGLKPGDVIKPGDTLAYTGNSTGGKPEHSTGPHLHHEWWIQKNGVTYTINEKSAFGKNIKNPSVQDDLINEVIKEGQVGRHGLKPEATVAQAVFADYGRTLTARNISDTPTTIGGLSPSITPNGQFKAG